MNNNKTVPTMLTYIEETPEQMLNNINSREDLTKSLVDAYVESGAKQIWIIASGSSFNSAQCARPFMMKYLDCDVKVVTPSTFNLFDHKMDHVFPFVISQSGCSTNSIDSLKKLRGMNKKAVGVTGNLESDFKDYSDLLVDYGVGVEKVGYVTKGVTTLVLYLILFALEASKSREMIKDEAYHLIVEELTESVQRHQTVQGLTKEFYKLNRIKVTAMSVCYSCGFTQSYGIACESALKIGETVQIPSFAYEAEEFIHGPNLQLTPNYTLFFIDNFTDGSERTIEIYKASRKVSDRSFLFSDKKIDENTFVLPFEVGEPLLSPLYILPIFQMLAYYITEELSKWDKHPLYEDFNNSIRVKSDKIKEIMPEATASKKRV